MRFLGAIAPVAVLSMLLSGSDAAAQWLNVPRAAIPRTAGGQPDLKAPAPKEPDPPKDERGNGAKPKGKPPARPPGAKKPAPKPPSSNAGDNTSGNGGRQGMTSGARRKKKRKR